MVIETDGGNIVHKLELNEDNLKKILLHEEVKGKPVVLVSVVGDLRKGKSFLLGFFLKYEEAKEQTKCDTVCV